MLSFRRAIIIAAFFLTVFFLIRQSHNGAITSQDEAIVSVPDRRPDSSVSTSTSTSSSAVQDKEVPVVAQKPVLDMSKMSLYDKLAYQFPYDVESKFPAYIWQTWKYTPASAEFRYRQEESSWTMQHPGFVHEVITDQVAENLLKVFYGTVPEVFEAYMAMPAAVLKADFFRYLILLARGGIYSDIDTYALKSALEWVPNTVPRESIGLVVGIEADPDRPDWHDWYSRRIQFCQWTIQAKAGHPVLRSIVEKITLEALKRKKDGVWITKEKSVVEFTGPAIWTDTVFEYLNDGRYFDLSNSPGNISWENFTGMEAAKKVGDVIVLPITSFSPGVQHMGSKDIDDPMAFVQHDFEGTWKDQVPSKS